MKKTNRLQMAQQRVCASLDQQTRKDSAYAQSPPTSLGRQQRAEIHVAKKKLAENNKSTKETRADVQKKGFTALLQHNRVEVPPKFRCAQNKRKRTAL